MFRQWRFRAEVRILFEGKVMKILTKKHWFLALSFKKGQVTLEALVHVSRHTDSSAGAHRETKENRKKLYFPNSHSSRSRRNMKT